MLGTLLAVAGCGSETPTGRGDTTLPAGALRIHFSVWPNPDAKWPEPVRPAPVCP